jgi:integrase/recombinase XerD
MPNTELFIDSPEPPRLIPLKRKRRAPSAAPQLASPQTPEATTPAKRKRRPQKQPGYLQPEEVERFFRAIESPRDRALFRLMYHAGLRASEVGLLQLRDYNPRTERIFIHRLKGSHDGEHHLCREESRVLHAWLKVRGPWPGPLFPSNRRSGIKRIMIHYLVQNYGEMADIPLKFRHAHIFKHTCATHLFDKGFGIEQVQDWLGHVNVQSTAIYAHITNSRRTQMADELRDTWK